jgi:hypothetical protein
MSDNNTTPTKNGAFITVSAIPTNTGSVITVYQIIKVAIFSATKAKLGALVTDCRKVIPTHHILEIMGHKQPPTPIQANITTTHGVVTNNIASKHLKSMDMKLH